jgi:hypothetical protein
MRVALWFIGVVVRGLFYVAIGVTVLTLLYVGAYCAMIDQPGSIPEWSFPFEPPLYRIGPWRFERTWLDSFFEPVHKIDVRMRPYHWIWNGNPNAKLGDEK